MQKPIHPRMGLSRVAECSSAPGVQKKGPTAAFKADQRLLKKEYKANLKAFHEAMRQWRAAQAKH